MEKSYNIIQFTPYFPPHVGWVEKVVEWIFSKWTYWKSFIYSGSKWQESIVYNKNTERKKTKVDNCVKMFFSSFDIVDNFPVPRLWTQEYRSSQKQLQKLIDDHSDEDFVVITHTRFFLSSVLGWIFARKNKLKWIHIEHGSDYVKLSSNFKNKIAYLYDKTLWKWVFKNADKVICISQASKKFVERQCKRNDILVWYRGIDEIQQSSRKSWVIEFVYIGRLVTLKWIPDLLEAFSVVDSRAKLTLIGDGPEKEYLETKAKQLWIIDSIRFLWNKTHDEVCKFLSEKKCIVINPSYQEWMPTTVIEALMTKNVVVASDVWGTREISGEKDLLLLPAGDILFLQTLLEKAEKNYSKLQGKSYTHVRNTFSREKSIETLHTIIR